MKISEHPKNKWKHLARIWVNGCFYSKQSLWTGEQTLGKNWGSGARHGDIILTLGFHFIVQIFSETCKFSAAKSYKLILSLFFLFRGGSFGLICVAKKWLQWNCYTKLCQHIKSNVKLFVDQNNRRPSQFALPQSWVNWVILAPKLRKQVPGMASLPHTRLLSHLWHRKSGALGDTVLWTEEKDYSLEGGATVFHIVS